MPAPPRPASLRGGAGRAGPGGAAPRGGGAAGLGSGRRGAATGREGTAAGSRRPSGCCRERRASPGTRTGSRHAAAAARAAARGAVRGARPDPRRRRAAVAGVRLGLRFCTGGHGPEFSDCKQRLNDARRRGVWVLGAEPRVGLDGLCDPTRDEP